MQQRPCVVRRAGSWLAWSLVLGLAAVPGVHAQVELNPGVDYQIPAAQLEVKDAQLPLSLQDAIEIALQRNLSLMVQRYNLAESQRQVDQNQGGIYDLNLNGFYSFSDNTFPTGSDLDGANVRSDQTRNLNIRLDQQTPWGGVASLEWGTTRFETNSQFVVLNPQYSVGTTLQLNQPLLRDFGRLATEHNLLVAQRNSEISRQTFEQQVVSIVQQVENAYWNLVQARKQLEVSRQSLALAQELHDRNKIKVEVGTLAPFELVQSEAGIAQREGNIIRDQASVGDAEDELRRLLNLPEGDLWQAEVMPSTEPMVEPFNVNIQDAIKQALADRPELRGKELEVKRLEIDSEYFRNQLKPSVDLVLSYDINGLSGDHTEAISSVIDNQFNGWTARVNVSVPVQNRSARARSAIADLAVDSSRTEQGDLEQQVVTEVRSAARQAEAASKQVEAARASRLAQEKSLEAERKRFENGMSTSFQVLQIQDNLTQAQSTEVAAITSFRIQLAAYYRAVGQLLKQNKVEIAAPEQP